MAQPALDTAGTHTPDRFWKAPVRALYWLFAASLAGAAILTSQGDTGHAAWGWIALGALCVRMVSLRKDDASRPVLWLITGVVGVLNLSGWLAPSGVVHSGATLAALVIAALGFATVMVESLQRATARAMS